MTAKKQTAIGDLVPDAAFRAEIGNLSTMCVWRYDHGTKTPPDWPPRIEINRRYYRTRDSIEKFKTSMVSRAIDQFKDRVETRKRRGYRVSAAAVE
jgi:hypothetical protein